MVNVIECDRDGLQFCEMNNFGSKLVRETSYIYIFT